MRDAPTLRATCFTFLCSFVVAAARLVLVLAAGLGSTSCTLLLATESEQCFKDADCAARGPALAGTVCIAHVCQAPPDTTWGCVGHVTAPSADSTYTAAIKLVDVITQAPVTDVTLTLCNKLDPACQMPVQTLQVAADGTASATVKSSFQGYFQVESTQYVTTLYFVDTSGTGATSNVSMLSPAVQSALNGTLGVTSDPTLGSVNISMRDCNQLSAAGVQFALAPAGGVIPYYSIASAISGTATKTDTSGNGGFINAKVGSLMLTATLASTGELLGQATTLTRAGAVTFQPMRPTPLQ